MSWKFNGEKPVYLQIVEHIRCDILQGRFPPGARINPVRELAMIANVNPNTMQRALTELEREGILVCCGTMGRFVTSDDAILENARRAARIEVARSCAQRLQDFGMTLEQAAQLLRDIPEEEQP